MLPTIKIHNAIQVSDTLLYGIVVVGFGLFVLGLFLIFYYSDNNKETQV